MNKNKKYIAERISNSLKISSKDSMSIVNKFINTLLKNALHKKIKIKNFGTFDYVTTAQRDGRNPKTKESYIIKPMRKLIFSAATIVKKTLN